MTDTPPVDIGEHTAALWARRAELRAAIDTMQEEVDGIDATIRARHTQPGAYGIGGDTLFKLQPNRAFDVDAAAGFLEPAQLQTCTVTTLDPKKVRALLPPALVDACMAERGKAKIVAAG